MSRPPLIRSLARPVATALGLCLLTGAALAGPVLDRIRDSGHIVLAHRESSVPFSYLDANKQPVGYAMDLCKSVAEAVRTKLGLKALRVDYLMVTPANRLQVIADGQADLECGSTTNNAERRQKVAFTVPHYVTGARILVRADSAGTEMADFRGKKLVSTVSTTSLKKLESVNRESLLGIQVLTAPDHAKALEMVEKGEADGFVMDDVLLYSLRARSADPSKLKVVGRFITIEPLAIMLPPNDPEYKRVVDEEMKRLITSHQAHAMFERWFSQPIPPTNLNLSLPMNYLLKDLWKYPSDQVPG